MIYNKYEINSHPQKKNKTKQNKSLKYPLYIHCPFWSFIPQKATFNSFYQTLSFFIMHFLTAFTKYSAFWNSTFSLCTFTKLHFFIMHFFQKAEPNSPYVSWSWTLHRIIRFYFKCKMRKVVYIFFFLRWKAVYIVECEVIKKSEIIVVLVRHTAKYVSLKGILMCIDFSPFLFISWIKCNEVIKL